MSPIEVMARAMWEKKYKVGTGGADIVIMGEPAWTIYVPEATAALLALSKMLPTAEMLNAAYEANNYQNDDMDNILIWEAMLDAAVKEGSDG